jgi:hypothetical protein
VWCYDHIFFVITFFYLQWVGWYRHFSRTHTKEFFEKKDDEKRRDFLNRSAKKAGIRTPDPSTLSHELYIPPLTEYIYIYIYIRISETNIYIYRQW